MLFYDHFFAQFILFQVCFALCAHCVVHHLWTSIVMFIVQCVCSSHCHRSKVEFWDLETSSFFWCAHLLWSCLRLFWCAHRVYLLCCHRAIIMLPLHYHRVAIMLSSHHHHVIIVLPSCYFEFLFAPHATIELLSIFYKFSFYLSYLIIFISSWIHCNHQWVFNIKCF
jgi:hypothetical protein